MTKTVPSYLPESRNKKFWIEGTEQIVCKPEEIKVSGEHYFIKRGMVATCTTCPFGHSIYLKKDQDIKDGKIIKKKKIA